MGHMSHRVLPYIKGSNMNDEILKIYRGTAYAKIVASTYHPYAPTIRQFTQQFLTEYEFDTRFKRNRPTCHHLRFVHSESSLYIPVTFIPLLLEFLYKYNIPTEVVPLQPVVGRDIDVKMNPSWHDKPDQVAAIEYVCHTSPARRGLALQTGKGKTYVANRAWVSLGKATMIVVAGFVDQWTKVILEQTNVGNRMYVVQGFESLGNLLISNFKPDVIVWSLATLRAYVYNNENYQDLPINYEQFLVKYGIGTKIFDEVHLNFHALTQVDLCSNVANNIYLTATFTSANKSTKRIFDKIYPVEMRFGAHDQDRYVASYFYLWNSDVSEKKCVVMRGYNHTRYESQLMKKETRFVDFMERVIIPLIRQHYLSIKRPGQKLLIFFATIVMIEKVLDYLTNHLEGDLVINKFVMGVHNRVLDESDIIVSTHKSCGTARDIKQLRTVINTISCKAETIVSQALGRLRKLKDEAAGDIPVYVDICDGNQSSHMRHYKDRSDIYKHKCLTYDEYRIF